MIHKPLPRRTFLRGLGTAIALPALEAMLPSAVLAASPTKQRPLRMAFLFIPNGVNMSQWKPAKEGPDFELTPTLEPLKNVRSHLTVLSGLTHDKARANGDGAGDHARSVAAFLTGSQPRKTAGADIRAGVSVDQVAARQIGKLTRFASLEVGCERGAQAGNCDSGYSCAYSSNISWRSPTTPMAKEVDPRAVFDRLFGNGDDQEMGESREKRDRYKKSVLDFVLEDVKSLHAQLGHRDQRKLDEYLTGVREIELRLARAEQENVESTGMKKPAGIPEEFGEHARLMADMVALAFQADLTRIATFMLANDGSNRPYRNIGISEGHHDLSHHGNDAEKLKKIAEINKFHTQQLAYFAEKLKSMRDADGQSVLDNSMIVYGCAISDGNRHNHDDLPVLLLGGGAGTIKPGRHIQYPKETPMANLFVSMLERVNVKIDAFGDSTGRLEGLS